MRSSVIGPSEMGLGDLSVSLRLGYFRLPLTARMKLELFARIKTTVAHPTPNRGISKAPMAKVPSAAPARSAARQPAAGLFSSPMICATTGN